MSNLHFALARLFEALFTALCVTFLVFIVLRIVPGDPVDLMLGENAAPTSRELLKTQLGLTTPWPTQFFYFMTSLLKGDLGISLTRHTPVLALIGQAAPKTLLLAFTTALFANVVGIPLGAIAAHCERSRTGRFIFSGSLLLISLPVFWVGPLLVVFFALRWPWLPVSSFESWEGLILPSLAMGLGLSGKLIQTTRAAIAETLRADFIRTAKAKGASELRVLYRHALPVAAIPILTVSALQIAHLVAGAVLTETLFDWPGMGRLLVEAIFQRDYPTIQGVVLVITLAYVAINTLTDLVNARISKL